MLLATVWVTQALIIHSQPEMMRTVYSCLLHDAGENPFSVNLSPERSPLGSLNFGVRPTGPTPEPEESLCPKLLPGRILIWAFRWTELKAVELISSGRVWRCPVTVGQVAPP